MRFYDIDGFPMTMNLWATRFEDMNYRRVAQSEIKVDGEVRYRVSTVWLGSDHSFSENGPPMIFETMVFPANSYEDQDCARYPSLDVARKGHQDMVTDWAAGLVDQGVVSVDHV